MSWAQNGGKMPQKGAKLRVFREKATLLAMAQLLYCHAVALIFVEWASRGKSHNHLLINGLRQNLISQIREKAGKRSIS